MMRLKLKIYKIDIKITDKDKFDYMNEYHYTDDIFREHCLQVALKRKVIKKSTYNQYMSKIRDIK